MDRRTALERLDAVRPGSDDLALPDLQLAREAMEDDPSLAAEFERRQNWDRCIATALHDVPLPEGLQQRLLEGLATAERAAPVTPPRIGRRRWLAITTGLAASIAAGIAIWAGAGSADPIAVEEIRNAAGALLARRIEPPPFQGDFTAEIPRGIVQHRLSFSEPAVGLLDQRVAAWRFQVNGRRVLRGVLAAIPVDQVDVLPTARSLSGREYVVDAKTVMWREGNFVYVCCVDGGIDELLRRLGSGPIA